MFAHPPPYHECCLCRIFQMMAAVALHSFAAFTASPPPVELPASPLKTPFPPAQPITPDPAQPPASFPPRQKEGCREEIGISKGTPNAFHRRSTCPARPCPPPPLQDGHCIAPSPTPCQQTVSMSPWRCKMLHMVGKVAPCMNVCHRHLCRLNVAIYSSHAMFCIMKRTGCNWAVWCGR